MKKILVIAMTVFMFCLVGCGGKNVNSAEHQTAVTEQEAEPTEEEQRAHARELYDIGQWHSAEEIYLALGEVIMADKCSYLSISSSVYGTAVSNIKEKLKNPFSYQPIDISFKAVKGSLLGEYWDSDKYYVVVDVDYTAQNSFGGAVRSSYHLPSSRSISSYSDDDEGGWFNTIMKHLSDEELELIMSKAE